MFKASRAKKALAVLLAVLLLASCLAVAGVSAATVVRMQTDYETAMSQYGETSAATNNVYKDAVKVRRCAQAGIGHNGSDGAMEIAFSGDTALPGAFRIFGSGVSAIEKGTAGTIYRVTFWYKVAALTGDAALTVGYGSANWSDDVAAAARAGIVRASRKLTAADVSDTWVEYSAVFKADAGNPQGFHVMLDMSGAATKAGTLLYVDDVTVEELPAGSTFAVHLDTAGGDSLPDVTGGQCPAGADQSGILLRPLGDGGRLGAFRQHRAAGHADHAEGGMDRRGRGCDPDLCDQWRHGGSAYHGQGRAGSDCGDHPQRLCI